MDITDPISNRVVQILQTSERIVLPLQELYQNLTIEGWLTQIDIAMFEYLLASDKRFELLEGLNSTDIINTSLLGQFDIRDIFAGPLVMLHNYAISTETVLLDVLRHLQEMNLALEHAWQARPVNDNELENEILSLLMMGDMLERQIKHSLHLDPLMPLEEVELLTATVFDYIQINTEKA